MAWYDRINPANWHLKWPPYQAPKSYQVTVVETEKGSVGVLHQTSSNSKPGGLESKVNTNQSTKKGESDSGKTKSYDMEPSPKNDPRADVKQKDPVKNPTPWANVSQKYDEGKPDFFVYIGKAQKSEDVVVCFLTGIRKGTRTTYSRQQVEMFTESTDAWKDNSEVQADKHYATFSQHPKGFRAGYSGLLEMVEKAAKTRNH